MPLHHRHRLFATVLSLLALCSQLWLPVAHTRAIIAARADDPLALAFCGGSSPAMLAILQKHVPEALLAVEKTAHLAYAKACCSTGGSAAGHALSGLPEFGSWLLSTSLRLKADFTGPSAQRMARALRPPSRAPPMPLALLA